MNEEKKLNVYGKLQKIQENLKAPKSRTNSFGKYSYRNCEDILESCKPLLAEYKAVIVLSDYIEKVDERFYVRAVASFIDVESGEKIENQAFARESNEKRGMDESQITGTASSYSRKYALNGLLAIDDQKDADSDEYAEEQKARTKKNPIPDSRKNPDAAPEVSATITEKEQNILKEMCAKAGKEVDVVFPKGLNLTSAQYTQAVQTLTAWIQKAEDKK